MGDGENVQNEQNERSKFVDKEEISKKCKNESLITRMRDD